MGWLDDIANDEVVNNLLDLGNAMMYHSRHSLIDLTLFPYLEK